ncbi:Putative ribonuclease H protein At1g65750 [Linum perenne]
MLGKQGWRLLSNPDTLVSRVFKAKYFPGGDFLTAPCPNGSSPIWQSIHATQGIVRRGYRWRIGDGTAINVWNSPWLRSDDNFFLETPRATDLIDLRVCDLFVPGLKIWDVEMIQYLFSARDASAILNIPLTPSNGPDSRIWHFSRKGEYTVRSSYRVIMERLAPRTHLFTPGPWRELWDIAAPPRLRCFAWRLAREILPTRLALQNRHLNVPSECGICNTHLENSWHLFLSCSFAQRCWSEAGIQSFVNSVMDSSESLQEWLFKIVESDDPERVARIIAILGDIWRERNNRVWNSDRHEPLAVVREGLEGLKNWSAARHSAISEAVGAAPCLRWHPPPVGMVKCNIDAAIFLEDGRYGMGALIRNDMGDLLSYRMANGDGCPDPTECEALALVEAAAWLTSLGYSNVILELDSLAVVNAVCSTAVDHTELGDIITTARRLLQPSWKIQFVRRHGNSAAHALARHSRNLTSPSIGVVSPPWLITALDDPCTICEH